MSEGRCNVNHYLDQLFSWPFNAGETISLVILTAGILAANLLPLDR